MINEEILEVLQCAHSEYDHFVIEPITLSKCGHLVCKSCVLKDDIKEITCNICGLISRQDFAQIDVSKAAQKLLKMCLEDVFKILENETSLKLNELKGMLTIMRFK